jgi:hypothetical protein
MIPRFNRDTGTVPCHSIPERQSCAILGRIRGHQAGASTAAKREIADEAIRRGLVSNISQRSVGRFLKKRPTSNRIAFVTGRAFRGHPKGLSLIAARTMARWRSRNTCVAAEHASSPRQSSRLPGSRSRSLYRSPGTPTGKSIDQLDFATIKLPAPAYRPGTAGFSDRWCRSAAGHCTGVIRIVVRGLGM